MPTETTPLSPEHVAAPAAGPQSVILLPDTRFFVRTVPVTGTNAAEVAAEVELALEALSPFPVAQLYHGHYWKPGGKEALAFAAYRRRFSAEETESWSNADLVIPSFAAALSFAAQAAGTVVVPGEGCLTAVHWSAPGGVPSRVLTESISPEATDTEREAVRQSLLHAIGGTRSIVDMADRPIQDVSKEDGQFVFRLGDRTTQIAAAGAEALDVRDKAELTALRRARARDISLWRSFLVLAAALVLAAVGEGVLIGLKTWQRTTAKQVAAQQPVVDRIMTAQALATRIEKLSTERLRPIEMISLVSDRSERKSIQFLSTTTSGLYGLEVHAKTNSAADVDLYQSALRANPAIVTAEVSSQSMRDDQTNFTMMVTFKPEALNPPSSLPQP